uniref:Uncharacterized protein n=1 Tax=Molossus molossus TaxID=27622 RepID=A0A7J8JUY9_MOLMO|nr:hypothetical protein HJG59_007783 [Molossus molossus]
MLTCKMGMALSITKFKRDTNTHFLTLLGAPRKPDGHPAVSSSWCSVGNQQSQQPLCPKTDKHQATVPCWAHRSVHQSRPAWRLCPGSLSKTGIPGTEACLCFHLVVTLGTAPKGTGAGGTGVSFCHCSWEPALVVLRSGA